MEYNIFNSLIWKSKINYPNKNELIKIIEEKYKKNPNQTPKEWKCLIHSSFNRGFDLQNKYIEQDLLNVIEKNSNEFLNTYEKKLNICGKYYISNAWYNAYKGQQFQEPHTHGDALFSGCYYLKFNKEFHNQTIFYNPNFDLDYSKLKDNVYFCSTANCDEDDLIIFPSFLKHGTEGIKNKLSDNIRITISFNIKNSNICCKKSNKNIINYV